VVLHLCLKIIDILKLVDRYGHTLAGQPPVDGVHHVAIATRRVEIVTHVGDGDEVVDDLLREELEDKKLDTNTVYIINFRAFYKNIEVKHCGWNNQKIKRLYNKTVTRYNDNDVHEDIITKNLKTELLQGNMLHYSYQSIEQFVTKANTYSTLFAKNNAGKKSSSPTKAFFNAAYSFVKTYFFKQGFRDGYVGLVIAFSHMATNFYKYIKLYELNKELQSK